MLVVQRLFYSQNDGITNSSKYQYILVKHLVARKLKAKATGWPQVKHSLWIWNFVKKKLTIHRSLTCIGMDQDTFTSVSNLVKHYRKILKCSYSLRDRGHKWLIIRTSNKQKKKTTNESVWETEDSDFMGELIGALSLFSECNQALDAEHHGSL